VGRPSKLTEDAQDRFLRAVSAGVAPEVAARHAGFSPASLYRYLRGSTPKHTEFRERYLQAVASLEIRLSGTLLQAGLSQPRWALALLERRFPERWGRRRVDDPEEDPADRTRSTPEVPIVLDPALLGELVPRLLEAGRQLSGRPAAGDAVDVSAFEDDGTGRRPAEEDDR